MTERDVPHGTRPSSSLEKRRLLPWAGSQSRRLDINEEKKKKAAAAAAQAHKASRMSIVQDRASLTRPQTRQAMTPKAATSAKAAVTDSTQLANLPLSARQGSIVESVRASLPQVDPILIKDLTFPSAKKGSVAESEAEAGLNIPLKQAKSKLVSHAAKTPAKVAVPGGFGDAPSAAQAALEAAGGRGEMKRLMAYSPQDLAQCEEGCLWRWLVHAMLQDVATAKRDLDTVREQLEEKRKAKIVLEQMQKERLAMQESALNFHQGLTKLNQTAPELRRTRADLQGVASRLSSCLEDLLARKAQLQARVKENQEKHDVLRRQVQANGRDLSQARLTEQTLIVEIGRAQGEAGQFVHDLEAAEKSRQKYQTEVDALGESNKKKKKKGGRSSSKSPQR